MRHLTVTDSDIIESVGFTESKALMSATDVVLGTTFGTLGVVFKSSPELVYEYEHVSAVTFATLVSAESIGKTFHELFRKTKAPFTKSAKLPTLKK